MSKFSAEEEMVMMLYSPGTREGLINELVAMKKQLTPEEKKLRGLADSIIEKMDAATDEDFECLDFFP